MALPSAVHQRIYKNFIELGSKVATWVGIVDSSGNQIDTFGADYGGIDLGDYDYISANYSGATSDVYTFKSGGAGGTTTATLTVTWTDTNKNVLSTVVKT